MAPSSEKAVAYIRSIKALPESERILTYTKQRSTIIEKGYNIDQIDKAIGYKPTGYFENQLNRFQAFGGGTQKAISDIGLGTARLVSHVLPEPLETKAQGYLAKQKRETEIEYSKDVLRHGGPRPATSYGAFAPDLALILGTFGGGEALVGGARGLAGLAPKVAPIIENAPRLLKVAKIGEKTVTGAAKWAAGTYGYEAVKKGTGAVPARDVAIGAALGAAAPLAGAVFKGGAGLVKWGLEKSPRGAAIVNALDQAIFSASAGLEKLGSVANKLDLRNWNRTLAGSRSKGLNILWAGEAEPVVGLNKQGVRDVVGEKLNPTPSLRHIFEPVAPHNGKVFVPKKTTSGAFDTNDLFPIADEAAKQEHIGELIAKHEKKIAEYNIRVSPEKSPVPAEAAAKGKKPVWYNPGGVETHEQSKMLNEKFNKRMEQLATEDPESYKAIQEFKTRLRNADDWIQQYAVRGGARTAEEFAALKEQYGYHVSMKRVLEIPESEFPKAKTGGKRALARRSKKGSSASTVSPTAQYAEDLLSTVEYVDRNEMKAQAAKRAMVGGEQGFEGDWVEQERIKTGLNRLVGAKNEPSMFEAAKSRPHPGDVTFRGINPDNPSETITRTIRLKDTLLADAINQTPVVLHPAISTILELGNIYYRKNFQKLITSMFGFMIRNQIRDPRLMFVTNPLMGQTGTEIAGNILPFVNNYMKAIGSISGGNTEKFLSKFGFKSEREIGNLLIQSGAKGGGYWEELTKVPELAREKLLSTDYLALSKGAEGGSKYNPLYWAQRYGHITESTPRRVASEMELSKLMADGIDVKVALREAAAKHHTATADFNDMGKWARIAGKLIPFGTSGLAGMSLIGNAIKNNPEGVATRMFYTATLPALLMWFRVKDEKWYKAIPQEEKNVYFYISENVRIPKTWDSDAIAITIPIAKLDAVNKDRPQEVTEALRSLVQTFLPSYTIPVVSAVKVATEKNPKHPYWGTPIEPKYSEDKASVQKYSANTSETAKSLSWALRNAPGFVGQLSPAKIDAMVAILTGPAGKAGLIGIDWINSEIKMATGKKMVKPATTLNDIPGISAIIRDSSLTSSNTQQVKDLYDLDAKIKEVNGKLDEAAKRGAGDFEKEYTKNKLFSRKILNDKNEMVENKNVKLVTDALKYIKDLNKKKIEASNPMTLINPDTKKTFTPQSKLKYINDLTYKINEAAFLVVKEIRSKEHK